MPFYPEMRYFILIYKVDEKFVISNNDFPNLKQIASYKPQTGCITFFVYLLFISIFDFKLYSDNHLWNKQKPQKMCELNSFSHSFPPPPSTSCLPNPNKKKSFLLILLWNWHAVKDNWGTNSEILLCLFNRPNSQNRL